MTTSATHGVVPDFRDPWQARAACRDDPEAWFPDKTDDEGRRDAQRGCAGCPVRRECLEKALQLEGRRSAGYRFGIWGGLTPSQRVAVAEMRWSR